MPPKAKKKISEEEAEQLFEAKFGVWENKEFNPPTVKLTTNRCGVKDKRHLNISSTLDAMMAVWPVNVWKRIVEETNERARSKQPGWTAADANLDEGELSDENSSSDEENRAPASPSKALWHDLSVDELKIWFGILIVMGLCPEPSFNRYWSKYESSSGVFGNDFIRKSGMS